MIWLTWRQQRLEGMIGGGVLALLALFLLWSGLAMSEAYHNLGVATCLARHPSPTACQGVV